MHPAFSVIFFTTLSGAGYGLLVWTALASLQDGQRASTLLIALILGLALATVGLLSSMAHLGKPGRAWRAFSQWRTSWLSREGVCAVLTYLPALMLGVVLLGPAITPHPVTPAAHVAPTRMLAAWALVAGALATVVCTAMIYASLKPIPAWRHRLVVPVYLLFALLTGGLLCAALLESLGHGVHAAALGGIVLALVLAACKFFYWRAVDAPLPFTRADAVGLKGREVDVFERPHTQANYLTTEMGFVLARKHGRRLRAIALVLFTVLPVLLLLPVGLLVHLDAAPWLWAAALSTIAGAFVERWLFFAQARHLVTLYY
jgi:sulfite dehydrogenase (quinone) subunit SoeC